ncbi:nucleoside phosphorylase domain-containing protein [Aspergillus sergii]|uniref:Nucleoside phosphorylase domain-containing protein n=1 Tax=Aspergillus sergii TaxID=1034303 RepID=A0A5N6XLA9_9EURO|nr:nucleoside phosphorylase domain-containing protein [Aspergillus sergii]
MLPQHRTPLHCIRHDEYTVGWVCALPIERYAAQKMLDETHAESYRTNNDTNIYTLGCINRHNVVIACLPSSQMGTNSAAAVAAQMRSTFPSIEFGLMVGIGGGVPSKGREIRLGDVVVGLPTELNGGVVQYDYGKSTQNGFQRTGFLNAPPTLLLNGISLLRATGDHNPISTTLVGHMSGLDRWPEFSRQAAGPDILFEADYTHVGGVSCESCDQKKTVERKPYERGAVVHYGTIASGNQVIRDATERDRLSSQLGGVLCFEMEAAGLMNHYACLVIRGICDYADSHKNKRWQPYAAGTAAVFAKEVLSVVPPLGASRLPVAQLNTASIFWQR